MRRSVARWVVVVATLLLGACGGGGGSGGGADGAADSPIDLGGDVGMGMAMDVGAGGSGGGGSGGGGGGSSPDALCGTVSRTAQGSVADILIVLDRSGSMSNAIDDSICSIPGCSKWEQLTPAITQVVAANEANIRWGLKVFPSPGTAGTACTVNAGVEVPVAPGNAAAVTAAITALMPSGSTPTRLAILAGMAHLQGLADTLPKYILLVTDGLPTCMPGAASTTADAAGTINALIAAASAGIPTLVVGIGILQPAVTTLDDLAMAGGLPRADTPRYYPAANVADLVSALGDIVGVAGTCTFAVGTPPSPSTSADDIDVSGGGAAIPRDPDHVNGWDFTGPGMTFIRLYGPTCAALRAGTLQNITLGFHCHDG